MAKHDLGDINQIRVALEQWLSQTLPGGKKVSLDEPMFPEESGESSVTLLLNGRCNGDELRYACRMKPLESQVFDEHDLELQYRLMEIAGLAGVPVPGLRGYESDPSLVGSDFYIMDFIDGQVPSDNPPYFFGGWVTQLSDAQRTRMWSNGLQTMAAVHMIDIDQHELPSLPQPAPQASPVQHELDKLETMFTDDLRQRMDPELVQAFEYLKANSPADGPRRLCWGDSRVGNVIWQDLQPVALIDWEMANKGDPLMDVSWWFWIDYVNSLGLGMDRLGGLPELQDIYQQWHAITGLPTDNSDYFDLFSLVRFAIILQRKFDALEAAGMGRIDNYSLPFVSRQFAICRDT